MQVANVAMNRDGSPTAQFALATLSKALNIHDTVLRFALEGAFDILPVVRHPGHALQIALARLGYPYHAPSLYATINGFGEMFAPMFSGLNELSSHISRPHMVQNPYFALNGGFGPQQYLNSEMPSSTTGLSMGTNPYRALNGSFGSERDGGAFKNYIQDPRAAYTAPPMQNYQEHTELARTALSVENTSHVFGSYQPGPASSYHVVKEENLSTG